MKIDDRLRERVPLAPMTTLGIGGPARFYLEVEDEDQLQAAFVLARARGVPVLVIGGGSNLVVADRGFEGLVVRTQMRGRRTLESQPGRTLIEVGAGEPLDSWIERCVEDGLGGVECLSGIPGSVGATPIQNVGAYGQEVAETIVRVRAFDREAFEHREFTAEACEFGYRTSMFRTTFRDRYVVGSVVFALTPGGTPAVRYPELARAVGQGASLAAVRRAVIAIRRTKSMVVDPTDPDAKSAGSFFVNPIVEARVADALSAEAPGMPRFAAAGGAAKLSAAWLIEQAGFPKGTRESKIGLSTKHALALVNRGGATAADLVAFAGRIREAVRARFGIALAPEPVFTGFSEGELARLFD